MNRMPKPGKAATNTPDWIAHWARLSAAQRTTPAVMPQGPRSVVPVPSPNGASNRQATFTISLSTSAAVVSLSMIFFLVLALGVMLGKLSGPVHTGSSLDVTKTTSVATAPTTQSHRVPDQNETTALAQAQSDTGAQCWLSWNVDSYDVMCATQHK